MCQPVVVFHFLDFAVAPEQIQAEEACRETLQPLGHIDVIGEYVTAFVLALHEMETVVQAGHDSPSAEPGRESELEVERGEVVAIILSIVPDVQHHSRETGIEVSGQDVIVRVTLQHVKVYAPAFDEGLDEAVVIGAVDVLHGRMGIVAIEVHQLGVETCRLKAQGKCVFVASSHDEVRFSLSIFHFVGHDGHSAHVLQFGRSR